MFEADNDSFPTEEEILLALGVIAFSSYWFQQTLGVRWGLSTVLLAIVLALNITVTGNWGQFAIGAQFILFIFVSPLFAVGALIALVAFFVPGIQPLLWIFILLVGLWEWERGETGALLVLVIWGIGNGTTRTLYWLTQFTLLSYVSLPPDP